MPQKTPGHAGQGQAHMITSTSGHVARTPRDQDALKRWPISPQAPPADVRYRPHRVFVGAKTSDLIPLCHPLAITKVVVDLTPDPTPPGVRIEATVKKTTGQRRNGAPPSGLHRGAYPLRPRL
jgi:cyclic pyranopterin phosphate synthase